MSSGDVSCHRLQRQAMFCCVYVDYQMDNKFRSVITNILLKEIAEINDEKEVSVNMR
jgi:hypothetical protein